MAGSINRVTLLGNLGKDPEIRTTQDGREIASFSIATSESWRDKSSGERREKVSWHNVVIFNEALAGIAKQYLGKGSRALVEGQLQTRKWTDQNGQDRYSTEVVLQGFDAKLVLLDGKGSGDGERQGGYGETSQPARANATHQGYGIDEDSEIPF